MVNTSLISQLWENAISFNFLANTLFLFMFNMFFLLKSHVENVNTCTLCYKLLCSKIPLIFCWFHFSLVCSHPLVEKSVFLALETRLHGNFVGSGENFPRLSSDKSFLLSDVWHLNHGITEILIHLKKIENFLKILSILFRYTSCSRKVLNSYFAAKKPVRKP